MDRPVLRGLFWFLVIMILGTAFGLGWGIFEANSIARKIAVGDPSDPGDMLHLVVLMYLVLGFAGGSLLGLLVASLVYLTKKNEIADRMLQEQGTKS